MENKLVSPCCFGPNLSPEAMEPDRSRQQVPEKRQRLKIPSTTSTELQPFVPEREDQQQEDHLSSPEDYFFKEIWQKLPDVQDINWMNQLILELFPYYESFCFPSIKNTSNLHPVTSTVSAQDSQAANVSPNKYSLDGFTYQTGTFTLWLKERFKESKDDDQKKTDLFIGIMKLYSNIDKLSIPAVEACEPLQSLLDKYQKKHSREKKQLAFAIVFLKDRRTEILSVVYPNYSKKRKNSDSEIEDTLHSEEILVTHLDDFFQKNGANVLYILIYTHYSPCTKREKQHIDPCMSLLRKKADQWHNEYGLFTGVAFKVFWGQSHPNYFNYVTDIPSDSDAFYPYIEKCDSIPFKLYSQDFSKLKPRQIQNPEDGEPRNREKQCKDIQSVLYNLLGLAKTSFGLKTDHLERGEKMIVQSLENFQVQDIGLNILKTLRDKWVNMVNNSLLSLIRKTLTANFNAAQVGFFVNDLQLGNNSPLQLYHILDRNL